MTVTIRPEQEEIISEALKTGHYESVEDVIARALEFLRTEDNGSDPDAAEKIERAFAQFGRGEFYTQEQARAETERRKAEWLREHRG